MMVKVNFCLNAEHSYPHFHLVVAKTNAGIALVNTHTNVIGLETFRGTSSNKKCT